MTCSAVDEIHSLHTQGVVEGPNRYSFFPSNSKEPIRGE